MMRKSNLGEFTEIKQIRFLLVGVLNTFFGYAAYAVFLFVGFPYPVALLLATICGIIFNYFNFGKFVFSSNHDWLAFSKFVTVYAAIYAINVVGLCVLMQYFLIDPYAGQLICVPPSVLLSWLLMNYWVFRR